MKETGTEELDGGGKKREEKKTEKRDEKKGDGKGKEKGGKKGERKDGLRIAEIRVRPLHDGTHHIEHHYEDKNGLPHHQTHGFSAPDKEGVADHMMEHLPEPPEAEEEAEAGGAAGAGEGEPQPTESQPAAAAEPGA